MKISNKKNVMSFDNGFLIVLLEGGIALLKYLNFVELFKQICLLLFLPKNSDNNSKKRIGNLSIDFFILMKWGLIIFLWFTKTSNCFFILMVWYLIFTNVFTYFYYHVWQISIEQFSKEQSKRRFISAIQAILFSILCYGYFYDVVYFEHLEWTKPYSGFWDSLYLSAGTTFTISFSDVMPKNSIPRIVFLTQLLNSFFIVAIVISSSIPNFQNISDTSD